MHPSKDIIGTKGHELQGKRIALGITGSVGCLRSVDPVSYTHLTLPTN